MRTIALALVPLVGGCLIQRVTETDHLTIDHPFVAVDAHVDAGFITLRGSGDVGTVTVDLVWGRHKPDVQWWMEGDTLVIDGDCPTAAWQCSIDLDIPAPYDAEGDLDTGSGGIEVRGLTGAVTAVTGSGSIDLIDLAGDVVARTGSGSIHGTQLAMDQLVAETGSGSIDLVHTAPFSLVDTDTGSGSIDLLVPNDTYHCITSTGSGSVEISGITQNDSASHVIRASTGSGSIQISGYQPSPVL